jgi:hypothetical protein
MTQFRPHGLLAQLAQTDPFAFTHVLLNRSVSYFIFAGSMPRLNGDNRSG